MDWFIVLFVFIFIVFSCFFCFIGGWLSGKREKRAEQKEDLRMKAETHKQYEEMKKELMIK
jgi:hypothetical protein